MMREGDEVAIWFKGDERIIVGTVVSDHPLLTVRCIGENGSTTTWTVSYDNVLAVGVNEAAPQ